MKTIGLVGGLSWYSTVDYYRIINETINQRLGGNEAARLILYSVNFGDIARLTKAGEWQEVAAIISDAAIKIEKAGADCILLGANTMHNIAGEVKSVIGIPLIHIADATASEIKKQGLDTVALLGTRYTMQFPFYRERLGAYGIRTIIPGDEGVEMVHNSIFDELGKGIVLPSTKQKYLNLIDVLVKEGAQGIILGCTEIPLLINQDDCPVPVFDTTRIHALAAVDFALAEQSTPQLT